MEWKLKWKNLSNENLKTPIHNTDYKRSKTTRKCGIFEMFE